MRHIAIALALALALFAPTTSHAATWSDTWSVSVINPGTVSEIDLPSAADADDISPVLQISHLASICMDTNYSTLPGTSEGAGQVEVLFVVSDGNTDGTKTSILGTLTAAAPCVHGAAGNIVLRIKTSPDTTGGIGVRGY